MKLTDIKVVYMCPDHNEKYNRRKNHMDVMLMKLGFRDIVHFKSGTEKYPDCLAKATKQILTTYLNEPILLLEDDVHIITVNEFDFIEKADAIYFGLTLWGGHKTKNSFEGRASFEHYSKNQARVLNMLSGHAILYISKCYKEAVINAMDDCIKNSTYNDVAMSRLQSHFLVLANKIPTFYQSLEFNEEQKNNTENVETWTKIRITDELTTIRL
jgi:hypothetical protein